MSLHGFLLRARQVVQMIGGQRGSREQIYRAVVRMMRGQVLGTAERSGGEGAGWLVRELGTADWRQ